MSSFIQGSKYYPAVNFQGAAYGIIGAVILLRERALTKDHDGCTTSSIRKRRLQTYSGLGSYEQNRILDGVDQRLRHQPTVETRHRKRLRPNATSAWELRIGDFRVLYDVDVQVRIVEIKRIGEKRGNALFVRGRKEDL